MNRTKIFRRSTLSPISFVACREYCDVGDNREQRHQICTYFSGREEGRQSFIREGSVPRSEPLRLVCTYDASISTRNQRVNLGDASISASIKASTKKGNRSFFLCSCLCLRRCVARVNRNNTQAQEENKQQHLLVMA